MSLAFSAAMFPSPLISSFSKVIRSTTEEPEITEDASTPVKLAVRATPLQINAAAMRRPTRALPVETTGAQFMGFSRRFVYCFRKQLSRNAWRLENP